MTRSFRREEQSTFGSPASLFARELLSHYDEPRSEGYDEYFDPPLESKYECPICLLGLREPVQTSCGHRFCRGCILRSIRDAGPKCPVDNERLNESQLYPDNFAKREMLSHDVFCRLKKQHGCPWKGPLHKLEDHLSVCEFVELDCPNECGRNLKRKDLQKHLEEECPNRTEPCRYCQEQVKWNGLEKHFEVSCRKYPQTCEKCGQENIPKDMGLRANVNQHVMEQLTGHLTDMSKKLVALSTSIETERQTQRTAPRRARGDLGARPQEQAAQEVYLSELSTQTHSHQGEIDELRHRVNNVDNNVHNLERRLEEIRMRQERPIQELTMRFNRYEARLLEYEGRVCNGSYIWRIENYRQCRQDAINGVTTAIYSPAFYTSLYGYKLCMRINLNGVDGGQGEHVALYVHMMQGDYDVILEWPFKLRKVEFAILDQCDATEARHHISRSLEVNPYAPFQMPTTPRTHQGHGFSEFAPIARIRDGHHVSNNTMLVCIQIFL